MAEEKSQPTEPTAKRQGVVTDSIVAFSGGLGIGAGGVGAAKIIGAISGAKEPPPEPPPEVIIPTTYDEKKD